MTQADDRRERPTTRAPHQVMESARVRAELTVEDLWWRYVALGGNGNVFDLDAHLHGISSLGDPEHDVLAHALNEALGEIHRTHLVPLSCSDAGVEDALRRHLEDTTGCLADPTPGAAPVDVPTGDLPCP